MVHEELFLPRLTRILVSQTVHPAPFLLRTKTFLPSDGRDASRLGLKQEEGYVWQGSQNQAYGKATRNLTADRSLDNRATAACAADTVDRTGI